MFVIVLLNDTKNTAIVFNVDIFWDWFYIDMLEHKLLTKFKVAFHFVFDFFCRLGSHIKVC